MTETTTTPFRKYDHLQRQGHRHTRGIEGGEVLVFPKLDGTNASVWSDGEKDYAGSRNRVLAEGDDNAGFCAWVFSEDPKAEALRLLARANPQLIFYGEWLVPHTLKSYRSDAWRRFWIFDVYDRAEGSFLHFDEYAPLLTFNPLAPIDLVPPIGRFVNPSLATVKAVTEQNTFLTTEGFGEGIVVKNYEWRSRDGDKVWGKFVRSEFKAAAKRPDPVRAPGEAVEPAIAEHFVTTTLVEKTLAKVLLDVAGAANAVGGMMEREELIANYRGKIIPQLLGRVWFDLIDEEMTSILRRHKGATIDFRTLHALVNDRVKILSPDLF